MSVSKWRYTEECNGRPCPGDCDHCSFEPSDLISRADAIEAVIAQRHKAELSDYNFALGLAEDAIRHLPSAEANPTVVRCKTMIPYGDFREWAKRIREDNPNVIVIPFDAEVVSADAVQGEWIFNPTDAIDLMFAKPKCSKCGFESSDGGNFCPHCGARMIGGEEE